MTSSNPEDHNHKPGEMADEKSTKSNWVLNLILKTRDTFSRHRKLGILLLSVFLLLFLELFTPLAPIERVTGLWVSTMPNFELSLIVGKKNAERYQNLNAEMEQYIQHHTVYATNGKIISRADSAGSTPAFLKKYLVDLENSRFYHTFVIDWPSVFRAAITDIYHGRFVEGASGIIQQFSRGIVLQNDRKFWVRKIREILIGYGLASRYTHQQLLHFYMSSLFLGSFRHPAVQIRGMRRGAKEIFDKNISQITKPEGLALITLISSPNTYLKNKKAFEHRYKRLASSLRKRNIIKPTVYQGLIKNIPSIDTSKVKSRALKIEYHQQIVNQLRPDFGDSTNYHSTIDLNVTSVARNALVSAVDNFKKQTGIKDLDGFMIVAHYDSLLAMIGSAQNGDKYMNNINIRTAWRPGSLVKPLIYSEYIRQGGNIYQKLPAFGPKTFDTPDGTWTVKNYSPVDNNPPRQEAINALARSNNVAAAYLAVNYGDSLREQLHKAGYDSTFSKYPATFIGANAPRPIKLFHLLQAYVPPYGKIPTHFITNKNAKSGFFKLFPRGVARETAYCLGFALKDQRGTLHFTENRYHWDVADFLGKTGTAQRNTSAGLFIVRPNGVSVLMGVFSRSGKPLKYSTGGYLQGASLAPYMQQFFRSPSIQKRITGQFHFERDEFQAKKSYYEHRVKTFFQKTIGRLWNKLKSRF